MVRDDRSASRTDEIKRLVQSGRYRIDPAAIADAMIRRGWKLPHELNGSRRGRLSTRLGGCDGAA